MQSSFHTVLQRGGGLEPATCLVNRRPLGGGYFHLVILYALYAIYSVLLFLLFFQFVFRIILVRISIYIRPNRPVLLVFTSKPGNMLEFAA